MLNKYDRKNNIIKVYIVFLDSVEKKNNHIIHYYH